MKWQIDPVLLVGCLFGVEGGLGPVAFSSREHDLRWDGVPVVVVTIYL